jgi:hypothetical protein
MNELLTLITMEAKSWAGREARAPLKLPRNTAICQVFYCILIAYYDKADIQNLQSSN